MSTHNRIKSTLAIVATLACGLLTSATAQARFGYEYAPPLIRGSDNPNFPGGFDSSIYGVAVDNSTSASAGDVYVADSSMGVVDKLNPTGSYLAQITPPAGPNGPARPQGVAVDPTSGDVYISDTNNEVVDKFDAAGVFLLQIDGVTPPGSAPDPFTNPLGVAVDNSGDVYITSFAAVDTPPGGFVDKFSPTGAYISQISGLLEPFSVEIDNSTDPADPSTGDIYVIEYESRGGSRGVNSVLVKYSSAGVRLAVIDNGTEQANGLIVDTPAAVGVDESGNVYSADGLSAQQYDRTGERSYQIELGGLGAQSALYGVAYSALNGSLYMTVAGSGTVPGVAIFERVTLVPPSVSDGPPLNVLAESAVLEGTVNPNGLDSEYHVEYWTGNETEHVHLASADLGTGFEGKPVIGVASGLVPGTTYHAALVASNAEGSTTGEVRTFTTAALPAPEASTGEASAVTSTSAVIAGKLDPKGVETTYRFEIGADTNYGAQIYGSGIFAEATPIAFPLQNLQPGTTYHYRFVAVNQGGSAYGEDRTFTTVGVPQSVALPYIPPLIGSPTIGFPAEAKTAPVKALTNAQKLAKALKACRAKAKSKRKRCEASSRWKYAPKPNANKRR